MTKTARIWTVLLLTLFTAASTGLAQSAGEAVYKSKCTNCHGAAGMADTSMARALKVKPISDPSVKSMSRDAMIAATENGMGKMQAYKGKLTDEQIKGSVDYFRAFLK